MTLPHLLKRRYRRDFIFKSMACAACMIVFSVLILLFSGIAYYGFSSFFKGEICLNVHFDAQAVVYDHINQKIERFDHDALIRTSLNAVLKKYDESGLTHKAADIDTQNFISMSARKKLYKFIKKHPEFVGRSKTFWLPVSDQVDEFMKGHCDDRLPAENQFFNAAQIHFIKYLQDKEYLRQRLNRSLFTASDSREPVSAGILGAAVGSLYLIVITLLLSFPIGVATALYLEELAPKGRFSHWLEIGITNLAAVPSVVFGILGLSIFINTFNLPRSSALVGAMTLALLTLPTIIVASRSALRLVPTPIKEAARGLGASPIQVIFHHVLPLSLPGILTGVIMSMARALGETAPLLMVGMMAFIADVPRTPLDAATSLPVQIFIWSRNPEPGFVAHAAAAILVLLVILGIMNATAIWLRARFEYKW